MPLSSKRYQSQRKDKPKGSVSCHSQTPSAGNSLGGLPGANAYICWSKVIGNTDEHLMFLSPPHEPGSLFTTSHSNCEGHSSEFVLNCSHCNSGEHFNFLHAVALILAILLLHKKLLFIYFNLACPAN